MDKLKEQLFEEIGDNWVLTLAVLLLVTKVLKPLVLPFLDKIIGNGTTDKNGSDREEPAQGIRSVPARNGGK